MEIVEVWQLSCTEKEQDKLLYLKDQTGTWYLCGCVPDGNSYRVRSIGPAYEPDLDQATPLRTPWIKNGRP